MMNLRSMSRLAFLAAMICMAVVASNPFPAGADDGAPRSPSGRAYVDPQAFVSQNTLFGYLKELTTIRPFAGWRNSGSIGEHEAMDLVQAHLEGMDRLVAWGLEIERQPFHIYSATNFRETRVELEINGVRTEVPAFGISGHRDYLSRALRHDSDGQVNDDNPDPVIVNGNAYLIRTVNDVLSLPSLAGRVALVDYALLDRAILGTQAAAAHADEILAAHPAAIIPVTHNSNTIGQSHGIFAGDLPIWIVFDRPLPPILNVRLEDLNDLGISTIAGLGAVTQTNVVWDMDVFSPGNSENLVARVPGRDPSRAIILGAHLDSPNNPGGIDDGSGSVTILQVAHAINRARFQPPVDLYLVWYGSHERGVYGSSHFVATHQDLLDRTMAMLQVDCLSVPLDGISMDINAETWTFGRFGDGRTTWPDFLAAASADLGVYVRPLSYYGLVSDNSNFTAWNVPNANLIFMDPYGSTEVHYAGHMHDPYDSAAFARREAATLENMARVALAAVYDTARDDPELRVTPQPDRRALFVASHTESVHMNPTGLVDMAMALAWHGFDIDMVPFGQALTEADLENINLVVALPVHDYPSSDGQIDLYDEAWTEPELDLLESYARSGGLLVVTNSARRLKYLNYAYENNEDWPDMNQLADRFGAAFGPRTITGTLATPSANHPLMNGVTRLAMIENNALELDAGQGTALAGYGGRTVVGIIAAGDGEVLLIGDLGILGSSPGEPANKRFWENLADYAR